LNLRLDRRLNGFQAFVTERLESLGVGKAGLARFCFALGFITPAKQPIG